jgi:predicted Rossmann fold nucleotide-binding protein DprA/Smf involved in DNA uptake
VTKVEDILEEMNIQVADNHIKYEEYIPNTPEEKLVFDMLKSDSKSADEMVAETKMNVIALNATLSLMELSGIIQNIGGGRYKLR